VPFTLGAEKISLIVTSYSFRLMVVTDITALKSIAARNRAETGTHTMMQLTPVAVRALLVSVLTWTIVGNAAADDLVLKRVMLSAGGVGYFEYEATVVDDAVLDLSVRLDQVDDVLKSTVVYDDKGRAGSIQLPGREPLREVFRDLPFDASALVSPVALLKALPGAAIRAAGQRNVQGRLVAVVPEHTRTGRNDALTTRHRVSVMTKQGLQSFLLEEAESVSFTNAALQAQIDRALVAVSAHRSRDRRSLKVVSTGTGARLVRVGYVVAAPLWKASYRMTLPSEPADTARLQGWAVLENMSGQDWNDVELTLISGNPVTFRQALYTAYYVQRPKIPVEVLGRVLPAPDTGVMALESKESSEEQVQNFRKQRRSSRSSAAIAGARVGAMTEDEPMRAQSAAPELLIAMADQAVAMPAPPGQATILAAASTEAATSVTFRIPYSVSVASGHSLMAPLVDREVPAARVSVYQPGPPMAVTLWPRCASAMTAQAACRRAY
jgi:hypothetical protein